MKKHREIESEQMLYTLITTIENDAIMAKKTIEINKDLCKKLGVFNYEVKDTNGRYKLVANRLYVIDTIYNGKHIEFIYDEEGRGIAYLTDDDELHLNHKYEQSKKENDSVFKERIIKSLEKSKSFEEEDSIGGEGRSLGHGEHEESQSDKNENSKKSKTSSQNKNISKPIEEKRKEKLENLLKRKDFSLNDKPKVRLNTIINGYYLWEILGIEEKLKGRLPEGVDETSFRNGYLTIFNSEELRNNRNNDLKDEKETTKDGGLEYKDKFAICTSDGNYIIELDETILKPKDMGTKDEQIKAQQSALKRRDGKKVGTFKSQEDLTYTDITGIALYEIPNVYKRFKVQESWTLSIHRNLEKERGINKDSTQYTKEITFGQQSLGETTHDREKNNNSLQTKLEPISEEPYQTKAEERQKRGLERFDPNEAMNVRNHSFKILADKCRMKYSNEKLKETFGDNLEKFIEIKKNEGLSDIEVMKAVGWKLGEVDKGRTIYDDHIPGERRRGW